MLWLIETHADDVYLSLHQHITALWKHEVKNIVTVYGNEKRLAEAEEYARKVGCHHIGLGYQETGSIKNDAVEKVDLLGKLRGNMVRGDLVLLPIGIEHPEHVEVASTSCPFRDSGMRVHCYLDLPCYGKQKLADAVLGLVEGRTVISMLYASSRKAKYAAIFKTQSKYFYYNPPEKMPRLEVVLR